MPVTISVITVARNSRDTIADTLKSVTGQHYENIEHIVIDGASKDGTAELVAELRSNHLKLVSEPDNGIYDAMNKGICLASGDVVGFLNSDDLFSDEHALERVAQAFENPDVDACYANLVYVDKQNRRTVRCWKSKPFKKGFFARGWCPAHPTFYVRKSVIDRLGAFDTGYPLAADADLMIRYLERENVRSVYIPHVLVRMRTGGVTNRTWRNIVRQNVEIFAALRKNGIPFSPMLFWAFKLENRFRQFLAGRSANER
ncbi:MAG: glycosyltransferase [Nitrospirota bacterium]|nr:glycosyltransferase [Nitrospirota bacterium]